MVVKRYRGNNPLLKMMDKLHPDIMKRYRMKWYVKDENDCSKNLCQGENDCSKNLCQGELVFRCVDKDKNKRIDTILVKLKKQYKLPTTEIINMSIRSI